MQHDAFTSSCHYRRMNKYKQWQGIFKVLRMGESKISKRYMKTFMKKLWREWIPLARISFGLLSLINSISNMKQMPRHLLRT